MRSRTLDDRSDATLVRRILGVLLVLAVVRSPLAANDGALDTSYHPPDGYVFTWTSLTGAAAGGAIAPDGAALALTRSAADTIAWARVPDEGLHTACSFAPPGASIVLPAAVTFDGSGRLLVAGSAFYPSLGWVVFVARVLYPACTRDPAFDGDGYFTFDGIDDLFGLAIATTTVVVQSLPVERIVVAGEARSGGGGDGADLLLVRLRGDGSLDPGFGGGDGWADYDFDAETNALADLAVDGAGRLVLAGTVDPFGTDPDVMIARTLPDGTLDGSFGSFGWSRFGNGDDQRLGALALEPGGASWLVSREVRDESPSTRLIVLRVGSDGQSTFGIGGPFVDGSLAIAGAVRQGDGRLIVVGDTDLADGDRDLFATACRPAPPLACSWENDFGPLGPDGLAYPLPDLDIAGDESVAGVAFAAGRPVVFLDADVDQAGRRLVVTRLTNAYIFADGFEGGTTRPWREE
jgi:hypothetical protein